MQLNVTFNINIVNPFNTKILIWFLDKEIKVLEVDKHEYSDTLNIERGRNNDISALMDEIEYYKSRKKKKKKK